MKYKAISILLMALFTGQSYAVSFEPLGERTLGEVYDNLMTAAELNKYITDKRLSRASVHDDKGQVYTTHKAKSIFKFSDIIYTRNLDVYAFDYTSTSHKRRYVIVIKGDSQKYSYAYVTEYEDIEGEGGYVHVHVDRVNTLNDNTTLADGKLINISIGDMAAQFEPLGDRKLGEVYDNLMTFAELNEHISEHVSNYSVRTGDDEKGVYTTYDLSNPRELAYIIDMSDLEHIKGANSTAAWFNHVVIIKGENQKYSFASFTRYVDKNKVGTFARVNHDGFKLLDDGTTLVDGNRVNIVIKVRKPHGK